MMARYVYQLQARGRLAEAAGSSMIVSRVAFTTLGAALRARKGFREWCMTPESARDVGYLRPEGLRVSVHKLEVVGE